MSIKVADAWLDYEARVLPHDAGDVQRIETRRAFYAGACALLGIIVNASKTRTETAEQVLHSIKDEIAKFGSDVKGGVA